MKNANTVLKFKAVAVAGIFLAEAYAMHKINKMNNQGKRIKAATLSLVAVGVTFAAIAVVDEVAKKFEAQVTEELPVPEEVEAPAISVEA